MTISLLGHHVGYCPQPSVNQFWPLMILCLFILIAFPSCEFIIVQPPCLFYQLHWHFQKVPMNTMQYYLHSVFIIQLCQAMLTASQCTITIRMGPSFEEKCWSRINYGNLKWKLMPKQQSTLFGDLSHRIACIMQNAHVYDDDMKNKKHPFCWNRTFQDQNEKQFAKILKTWPILVSPWDYNNQGYITITNSTNNVKMTTIVEQKKTDMLNIMLLFCKHFTS